MFERLEEAVSVYSITGDNTLLKEILEDPDDDECEKVMKYYRFVYKYGRIEKTKKEGTVINKIASVVDKISPVITAQQPDKVASTISLSDEAVVESPSNISAPVTQDKPETVVVYSE